MNTSSELLPFPDMSNLDYVPRCREGIQRLIALSDDERHTLQDNLDNGSVGEPIVHSENPSRGYVLTWNKIVGFIQEKVDGLKNDHEFFKVQGHIGAMKRWHGTDAGAHRGGIGGLEGGNSGAIANSNHNSNQNNNINDENESNLCVPKLNSLSLSEGETVPIPKSIREVMAFANSKKNGWNVSQDEATVFFEMNNNNGWNDYSTNEPICNWHGAFHNYLLCERCKEQDKIWLDRLFELHDKAETFGIEGAEEIDKSYYESARQVLRLKLYSKDKTENKRLAMLKHKLEERCKAYEAHYGQRQPSAPPTQDTDEQPF